MQDAGFELSTQRLALRRFTPADLDWLAGLNSDVRVMRFLGGAKSRADSEKMLRERILDYYGAHPGLGIWITLEKSSGDCIGMHLLNHIQGESHIQVGYVLAPAYWGRGHATEMCLALLRYGFTDLGLPRIVAITDLTNIASQRVLLKSGLQRKGERAFPHPAYAKSGPMAWFERDAGEWLGENAGNI